MVLVAACIKEGSQNIYQLSKSQGLEVTSDTYSITAQNVVIDDLQIGWDEANSNRTFGGNIHSVWVWDVQATQRDMEIVWDEPFGALYPISVPSYFFFGAAAPGGLSIPRPLSRPFSGPFGGI